MRPSQPPADLRPILVETPICLNSTNPEEIGLTYVQLRLHGTAPDGSYRILSMELASN